MYKRVTLTFTDNEFEQLQKLSQAEHRDIRQQAAYLVRVQLEKLGLVNRIHAGGRNEKK